jgi:hypothetical protein
MKKLFTLLTLLVAMATSAWADVTWPDENYYAFDGGTVTTDGVTITAAKGSSAASTASQNSKFAGNSSSKCLKMESATTITFTTTAVSTLTIVQAINTGSNRAKVGFNLDSKDIRSKKDYANLVFRTYSNVSHADIVNPTANNSDYEEVRVYTLYNVPAGEHTIKKGPDCQTFISYVGFTYETTTKKTITTAMDNGGTSTVTGGGSYWPNDSVELTATPGTGKAFSKWIRSTDSAVLTDNPLTIIANVDKTYTAYFINAATKGITVESSDDVKGSAEATATTVPKGGSTTLTATPSSEAYYFVNWTKSSDGSWSSTTNPLDIAYDDLADGETYTANFEAFKKITYSVGTSEKGTQTSYQNGTLTKYADNTGNITMPNNYAFVYSDDFAEATSHTLKYWSNGGPNYSVGSNYNIATDVTALVPVFAENTVSLSNDLTAPQTVTWNFASNSNAPDVHVEGNTGYYVVQTTIGGTTIDVPMYLTGAKFNMGETRAQVNKNTNFKVPAVKGMVITYTADSGSPAEDQFGTDDDANVSYSISEKVVTITYTGTNSSLTITDKNGGYWPKSLAVTYPKSTVAVTIASSGYSSLASAYGLDFANATPAGLEAYVASAITAGGVTLNAVTEAPASTGVILKGTPGETYNIPVKADAAAVGTNYLHAAVAAYNCAANEVYILKDGKFCKVTAASTVPAGKAYLLASDVPASAPELEFNFGGTTGIKSVDSGQLTVDSSEVYNLAGQRVAQPTKGLYIVNGRKVVIK